MTFKQFFAAYFVSQALSLTGFAASLPHIDNSAETRRPVKRADPTWHPSCDEHPQIKDAWPRALHMAQHAIDVLTSNDPFSDQNAVNQSPFELWWEPARLNLFGQNSLTSHDEMLSTLDLETASFIQADERHRLLPKDCQWAACNNCLCRPSQRQGYLAVRGVSNITARTMLFLF
jgi:hypothetical protein